MSAGDSGGRESSVVEGVGGLRTFFALPETSGPTPEGKAPPLVPEGLRERRSPGFELDAGTLEAA
jgi:hypothetical protein